MLSECTGLIKTNVVKEMDLFSYVNVASCYLLHVNCGIRSLLIVIMLSGMGLSQARVLPKL